MSKCSKGAEIAPEVTSRSHYVNKDGVVVNDLLKTLIPGSDVICKQGWQWG